MLENIGKLTTPNNDGASIEVNSSTIKINNPLEFDTLPFDSDGNRCSIFGRSDKEIRIYAQPNNNPTSIDVASLFLYGNDLASCSGEFRLRAHNTIKNENYDLIGRSSGQLLFNGLNVELVYTYGNNYIQYYNGLLICWDAIATTNSGYSTWTFPKQFISTPMVFTTDRGGETTTVFLTRATTASTTNCKVATFGSVSSGTGSYLAMPNGICCLAIGRWK